MLQDEGVQLHGHVISNLRLLTRIKVWPKLMPVFDQPRKLLDATTKA